MAHQKIKTGCGEKIPQIRDFSYPFCQFPGLKSEFGLIMRIDEIPRKKGQKKAYTKETLPKNYKIVSDEGIILAGSYLVIGGDNT